MNINVRILDSQIETKKAGRGSYKCAVVDYKELESGKAGTKKVMSFGDSEAAFGFIANKGDSFIGGTFTVTNTKVGDYWNWTSIKEYDDNGQGGGGDSNNSVSGNNVLGRSGGAATSTDAARQRLIVRQNALTNAIKFLEVTGQKKATITNVAQTVEEFTDIVFDRYSPNLPDTGKVVGVPEPATGDLEDDIPF